MTNRAMITNSFTFDHEGDRYQLFNTFEKANNANWSKALYRDGEELGDFRPEDDHVRAYRQSDKAIKLFHNASKVQMQVDARNWIMEG